MEQGKTLIQAYREQKDEIARLKQQLAEGKADPDGKPFKVPLRWKWRFKMARRKNHSGEMLVFYFNKKNEIEAPKFMRMLPGDIIIWNNKPYHYNPKAIWRLKVIGYPQVYCIREIDMRPISNLDFDKVKQAGFATDGTEIVMKQLLQVKTNELAQKKNMIIGIVVVLIIIGGIIWFLSSGPKGPA